MAKASTTMTDIGAEVYEHDIYRLTDEYIASLPDESSIYKRITFTGCLRYIYNHLFKPTKDMVIYNNRSSILDYSNIFLLMDIYNIFIDLCTKYKQEYTKNKFLMMTGISDDTILNWSKGIKIPTVDGIASSLWVDFSKKISENSELALSESMLDGNLMAYAQLKCWYGWREEPQQIEVKSGQLPTRTAAEIAAGRDLVELPEPERPEV